MRKLLFTLFFFSSIFLTIADETDKYCIVCGKGPLDGMWYSNRWGYFCEECNGLTNRCADCGLPIRDGHGVVIFDNGRMICKFCHSNAVLDVDEAREIFSNVRNQMVDLYGKDFTLKYPDVVVDLYDKDLGLQEASEGVDIEGYARTAHVLSNGTCAHQVLLRIGALRASLIRLSAHEYTHLWINENRPKNHVIDHDTVEAICDLSMYKLMESQGQQDQLQRILNSHYTHGKIKRVVELEEEKGVPFILNWVKNSLAPDFDSPEPTPIASAPPTVKAQVFVPKPLPSDLKYTGQMDLGKYHAALINGISFAPGDEKTIRLRDRKVQVRCESIVTNEVRLKLDGKPDLVILKLTKSN